MTGRPAVRRSEQGFTLIELLIVVIIVGIVIVGIMMALRNARVAARNDSMRAAASAVDQAIGTFNRMYPVVGGAPDRLAPAAGVAWTGNIGSPATGLADETGEWLLRDWPIDPFTGDPVTVLRSPTAAYCAAGAPGTIRVCRLGAATGRQTYEIAAWGRSSSGATIELYRARHGTR